MQEGEAISKRGPFLPDQIEQRGSRLTITQDQRKDLRTQWPITNDERYHLFQELFDQLDSFSLHRVQLIAQRWLMLRCHFDYLREERSIVTHLFEQALGPRRIG